VFFVCEDDEQVLWQAMLGHGRGFQQRGRAEQRNQVRASRLYGQWLRSQAEHAQLPVLAARPRETLVERILLSLG
jgi:hypothetical protein